MRKRENFRLAEAMERWFASVKRPMPWRLHPAPYVCWLSEIMMQQTTYATVLPYYRRFLERFPSVEALAAADEQDVLKAWEGLGYYARARNLLRTAREIVGTGKANWPKNAAEWAKMPGVGPYTAAALSSVLTGERVAVVDGNVARVFARFWELTEDFSKQPERAKLAERLKAVIARADSAGDFNQAMMELGALVCTPREPRCEACPLVSACAAKRKGTIARFPAKRERRALPLRETTVVIVRDCEGRVLLTQNCEGGLLKGLWELPEVTAAESVTQVFSHFKLSQAVYRAVRREVAFKDPSSVPLTTATRKALGLSEISEGVHESSATNP